MSTASLMLISFLKRKATAMAVDLACWVTEYRLNRVKVSKPLIRGTNF